MTKLCKDCVYYKHYDSSMNTNGWLDECTCPELKKKPNPVTGEVAKTYCSSERDYDRRCGQNGRYWKSKDAPEPEPNIQDSWLNKIFNIF